MAEAQSFKSAAKSAKQRMKKEYFSTLSYEEKQRYTLSLSEKYLRALERFRRESEFAFSSSPAPAKR